jgi:hypothetical protein
MWAVGWVGGSCFESECIAVVLTSHAIRNTYSFTHPSTIPFYFSPVTTV